MTPDLLQRLTELTDATRKRRRHIGEDHVAIKGPSPSDKYFGLQIRDCSGWKERQRLRNNALRQQQIAILDFETDPFDKERDAYVFPFLGVLYSDQFEPQVIWEEDHEKFVERILSTLAALQGSYTIYAHNGGRFDYMFLLSKLRGLVRFKGRGIMSCKVGNHELRDSFHIIPEKLANWKKDDFDYSTLRKSRRNAYRARIVEYCINDCKYLLQIIRKFISDNGLALSIGQASLKRLKQTQTFERIGEHLDGKLRGINTDRRDKEGYGEATGTGYFYGGRVECIAGRGKFSGRYNLYDVNSMYPYVMATHLHPIGNQYTFREGVPGENTCFLHVTCENHGALISKGPDGETTADKEYGDFFTTIWEYRAAIELGLISSVSIKRVVDCNSFCNFERYVTPIYAARQITKHSLAGMQEQGISSGDEYDALKLKDICLKLYLNNAYGKFAQNPRKYREHFLCGSGEIPSIPGITSYKHLLRTWEHIFSGAPNTYDIWRSKGPQWQEEEQCYADAGYRFYNIGTGASITGAARAKLLRAICVAKEPLYCDTDSLICRDINQPTSSSALGEWKLEKCFDQVIIAGKKQYAAHIAGGDEKDYVIRNKGVSDMTWEDMERLLADNTVTKKNTAPTITKFGAQYYMQRTVRATALPKPSNIGMRYGTAV